MKLSNYRLILNYIKNDEYIETHEERTQLVAALVSAVEWGEKVDAANQKYKEEAKKKGVMYHTDPLE